MSTVPAGGLAHRVLEWGSETDSDLTLLAVHGYLDCGGSFSLLVDHLPPGVHVVAPDMRGHGCTERVAPGGHYHFVDYVMDLRDLVDRFRRDRLVLLGHSMGGGISVLFAGAWPGELSGLVLLEGLGPPEEDLADGPERMRRWVRETRTLPSRGNRVFDSRQAVADRLVARDPQLRADRAWELAGWLAEEQEEGRWTWRHDPQHRVRNPLVYRPDRWTSFLQAISCPVLAVTGGKSWYRWPDLPERRAQLADLQQVELPEAGHMLHHDRPEELGRLVGEFLEKLP